MKTLLLCLVIGALSGCGINSSLSFTTNQGSCATFNQESTPITESAPAPYCMQVTMSNSGAGQNFVNSTASPISNIQMTVLGATNISSPATSSGTMDPNNCQGVSLNPGSTCTFYLKIYKEAYPVNTEESFSIVFNYNTQNSLFNTSGGNGVSTLNLYEATNLYIPQSNGNVGIYNATSTPLTQFSNLFKTSNITIATAAMDNSAFGYLYLGGTGGIYLFGVNTASPSISLLAISGATNLLEYSNSIYATSSNNSGIYKWNFATMTWSSGNVSNIAISFESNVRTVNPTTGLIYLVTGSKNNQVYNCNPSSTVSTSNCIQEGSVLPSSINALAYSSTPESGLTGLYVGTNQGLYAESSVTNTWSLVTAADTSKSITAVEGLTTDKFGDVFAGDESGNIWVVPGSGSTGASNNQALYLNAIAGDGIKLLQVDDAATILYFITNSGVLYSCSLGLSGSTPSCSLPKPISAAAIFGNAIGLKIGSQINTAS